MNLTILRLQDKVVVVTGGASGIGAATCLRMSEEGAHVVVLDASPGRTFDGLALPVDVRDEAGVRQAFEQIAGRYGRVDVVVNNAGVAVRHAVHEADEADWTRILDVCVMGAFLCSKAALPLMTSGASIVHISSVTGITGVRSRAAYSSAKGALVALAKNMAMDYAPRGIRVNCVCPGFVRTPLTAALTSDPDRCRRLTALHPLGRLGEAGDVANAIVFLSSEEASWITGHALVVDGGFSAGHAAEI
jgi:NAD(P)-dependent dehydrogenase (short-subunit alcohol dehydrogenase family)